MMTMIYKDGTYYDKNPTWHAEDSPWKAKHIVEILKKNDIAPNSICEIGCGAGDILSCLSDSFGKGVQLSGFEISPQAFEICKKKEAENLHFHLESLFDGNEYTFDAILAIDVFEHVEDYFGFLRQVRRKATYKIFHIPLDLSVQEVFRSTPILVRRSKVGHIHYFTKETALETLRDTGYEILDYFYTSGCYELPHRGWKSDLISLPRKLFFQLHQDLTARILGGFSLLVLAK